MERSGRRRRRAQMRLTELASRTTVPRASSSGPGKVTPLKGRTYRGR